MKSDGHTNTWQSTSSVVVPAHKVKTIPSVAVAAGNHGCIAVQFTSRQCHVRLYSTSVAALFLKPPVTSEGGGQRPPALIVLDKLQLIALVSLEES